MLNADLAGKVINAALEVGAYFADIFIEKTQIQNISFTSSKVEDVQSGINFGVGIRLIYGDQSLYGHSNKADEKSLINIVKSLGEIYKRSPVKKFNGNFSEGSDFRALDFWKQGNVSLKDKIEKLSLLDKKIRGNSNLINQVKMTLIQKNQEIEIFDSEGLHKTDTRPYIRLATSAVAKDGDKQNSAFHGPGAMGGWEFIESLNMDQYSDIVAGRAVTVLGAKPCPAGKMPVVIENGFGGVIFHEACGHLLETTSVEKKASVFWDKKGKQIAHSAVNAVDDGTIHKEWGSIKMDDEGMETQKTQLIENGVLKNFLCDRMGEIKTEHKRTGSARRQNYSFHPASRMRNTYIEPGEFSVDELLASADKGLYCKAMGGGSVNPGTGEFNFAVEEGYLIENGKITTPVKGATLIGTGPDVLMQISMVGKNLSFAAGMCGSVSGAVPVTVGQPALKVESILVGGQS